jgi:imidazolonepropionase-like amidohydrolase
MRPSRLATIALLTISCAAAPEAPPAAAPPASPPAPRVLRFDVVMAERVAGAEVVTLREGGSWDGTYEFTDRGRGPKLAVHVEVGADGAPRAIDITGNDYYKAAVDEHLALRGATLAWDNGAERGEAPAGAGAVYTPLAKSPALTAALARALLHAPDHARALLPAGRAQIERGGDLVVEGEGAKAHVTRYDLLGLDFEPTPVWLDDEGQLFAMGSEWWAAVRSGFRSVLPRLFAEQEAARSARLARLAKSIARVPPPAGLAITHARIVDVEARTAAMGTIVVKGDRIVAVGPEATTPVPPGALAIDAAGKTVIPGLWDMHTHVDASDGLLHVAAGVTTVRDLANDMDVLQRLRKSWDAGETIGPRLLAAGFIDGRGPFQGPTKVFADTEEEARADVAMYAARGYVQIKVYSSLKPALVPVIVAEAHRAGLRVSGHVPNGMIAADAVNAGFDELQHMNFVFLDLVASRADDTRTPLRFTLVAERGAGLDLKSQPVKDFVALLASHHTVVDPTLDVFEALFTDRKGTLPERYARYADRLPVGVRRDALRGGLPVPEGKDATFRASFARMLEMTKLLHDSGIRLVAGTDSTAGFDLHRELELYEKAGIAPAEVLAMATIGAARVMKRDKDLGSIAAGKLADLVLVDGKPDAKLADLDRVVTVIKGGVAYGSNEMYAALGVGPVR